MRKKDDVPSSVSVESPIRKDSRTLVYLLLAVSGGAMDAHSYLNRGHVFANAQTGNLLLLGVSISDMDMRSTVHYLFPILAFVLGIALADLLLYILAERFRTGEKTVLLLETLIMLSIAYIPQDYNSLANALTSFACGMQLEAFREFDGSAVPTTMCIGNLRCATSFFIKYLQMRDRSFLAKSALYAIVIAVFVCGAIIEGKLIKLAGNMSILFSAAILFVCLLISAAEDCRDDNGEIS